MSNTQKTRPTVEFSTEEILKLKGLLDTLTEPANSCNCSLAFAGYIPYSCPLNPLNSTTEGVWVVDSRATNHMTQSSTGFISYRSCPSNKNCNCISNFHYSYWKRRIMINLNDVLHVLKLSANLIFVHKLTMDLHCLVFFNPTTCQFQDQGTGKVIGLATEDNGLYLPEGNRMCRTESNSFVFDVRNNSSQ